MAGLKEHVVEPMTCPYCGYEIDRLSGVNHDKGPDSENSLAICLRCANPQIIEQNPMRFRALTTQEWEEISRVYEVVHARATVLVGKLRMADDNSGNE